MTPPEASQQKGGAATHIQDTEGSAKSWRKKEISVEKKGQATEETGT